MTAESSSTKNCPDCAEVIKADAVFCPYCGFSFVAAPAPAPAPVEAGAVPAPPPPVPQASSGTSAPVGEIREGIVGSARTRLGEVLFGASVAAMILVNFAAAAEVTSLAWGEHGLAYALTWPAFIVGAIIVAVIALSGARALAPRSRDVGSAAKRSYRARLKGEYGIGALYRRRGMRGSLVAAALLLIGLGAGVLWQMGNLRDDGYELRLGIYLAAILVVVALVGAVLMWPSGSAETVYMDKEGNIHRQR